MNGTREQRLAYFQAQFEESCKRTEKMIAEQTAAMQARITNVVEEIVRLNVHSNNARWIHALNKLLDGIDDITPEQLQDRINTMRGEVLPQEC